MTKAGVGLACWLLQVLVLFLHPGVVGFDSVCMMGSLSAFALAIFVLSLVFDRPDAGDDGLASLLGVGAVTGILVAASHMLAIAGMTAGTLAVTPAAFAIGAGALAGAVTAATLLLPIPLAIPTGIASAASGLALSHLLMFAGTGAGAIAGLAAAGAMFLIAGGGIAGYLLRGYALDAPSRREPGGRFRLLAEVLPIPMVLTAADSPRIIFANHRFQQQFPVGDQGGLEELNALYVHPEAGQKLVDLVRRTGVVENHEMEVWNADGTVTWVLISARTINFVGEPAIVMGFYDISDRKAAEEALLASEVRYALISRASNDGIWDWDIPTGTVYFSARWKEIVGIEPGNRLHSIDDWLNRVHPEDIDHLRAAIGEHIAGRAPQLDTEYRIRHGSGHYCWMHCRAIAMRNAEGKTVRMAGSQADVTLRKTYEINLLNAAYEDRLTGIKNRAFFSQLVDIRNNGTAIWGTAIILVNIDQFRRVNDSVGTVAGDALLIAVVRHLSERIGAQDALARLGNDEFAIWLHNIGDHLAAQEIAEGMLGDINHPYLLNDVEMPVTVSIGLAAPTLGDAASGADLLRNARLALDHAKHNGGSRVELFDDALLRETNLRRQLSRDLVTAERQGEIFLEYQPLVELAGDGSNRIMGFESLMRWRHDQLGLIPPTRFIPLAEESGLINPLGLYAIETAANALNSWIEAGIASSDLTVSVNLSPRQVSTRAGVQRVLSTIDTLAMPPGRLKLEITESVLMNDPDAMVETFEALRQRGVLMLLDDFGTGYSSLSYLHRFPLWALKIDRSFISRMSAAPEALRLVRSIIELGHDLGLRVVAEGVETNEQSERLRDLGCDFAQGYYFSRPLSAKAAQDMLTTYCTGGVENDAHYAIGPVRAGGM